MLVGERHRPVFTGDGDSIRERGWEVPARGIWKVRSRKVYGLKPSGRFSRSQAQLGSAAPELCSEVSAARALPYWTRALVSGTDRTAVKKAFPERPWRGGGVSGATQSCSARLGALTLVSFAPSVVPWRRPSAPQDATRPPHRSLKRHRSNVAQGTQTRVARLGGTPEVAGRGQRLCWPLPPRSIRPR